VKGPLMSSVSRLLPALEPDRTANNVSVSIGRTSLPPDAKRRMATSLLVRRYPPLE
jgi:hypothetical protein